MQPRAPRTPSPQAPTGRKNIARRYISCRLAELNIVHIVQGKATMGRKNIARRRNSRRGCSPGYHVHHQHKPQRGGRFFCASKLRLIRLFPDQFEERRDSIFQFCRIERNGQFPICILKRELFQSFAIETERIEFPAARFRLKFRFALSGPVPKH